MPQFVAQILSLDGYVILSNVEVSIDFSPQGPEWRGCDRAIPNPNRSKKIFTLTSNTYAKHCLVVQPRILC